LYEKIKSIVFSFRFVEGVHEIEIHTYGKNRIISLHIEMNPALTLEEVHGVADGIEKKIYNENLGRCVVHVDLKKGAKIIEKKRVEKLIKNILATAKDIKDFHGMEIITSEEKTVLNFHLLLDKNASIEESHLIYHRLSNLLKEKFGFSQVNIHIEPYKEVKNDGD
jgi:divalent metal cation (Fe/Co/Zn/Cd) transporter